jgi:hypothetical protein
LATDEAGTLEPDDPITDAAGLEKFRPDLGGACGTTCGKRHICAEGCAKTGRELRRIIVHEAILRRRASSPIGLSVNAGPKRLLIKRTN